MNYNALNCEIRMQASSYSVDFLLFKPILGPQEGLKVQLRGNLKSRNTMPQFMIHVLFRDHPYIFKFLYQVQKTFGILQLYIVKSLIFLGLWSSNFVSWSTISKQGIFIRKYICRSQLLIFRCLLSIFIFLLFFYIW